MPHKYFNKWIILTVKVRKGSYSWCVQIILPVLEKLEDDEASRCLTWRRDVILAVHTVSRSLQWGGFPYRVTSPELQRISPGTWPWSWEGRESAGPSQLQAAAALWSSHVPSSRLTSEQLLEDVPFLPDFFGGKHWWVCLYWLKEEKKKEKVFSPGR